MNGDNLHPWIDPELEARVVALVLGEASDFEREELERLMAENAELALLRKRFEAMHGLLREAAEGDPSTSSGHGNEEWKLSPERRAKVLEVIGGERVAEGKKDGVTAMGEAKRREGASGWAVFAKIAAVICLLGAAAGVLFVAYTGGRMPMVVSLDRARVERGKDNERGWFEASPAAKRAPEIAASSAPAIPMEGDYVTADGATPSFGRVTMEADVDGEAARDSLAALHGTLRMPGEAGAEEKKEDDFDNRYAYVESASEGEEARGNRLIDKSDQITMPSLVEDGRVAGSGGGGARDVDPFGDNEATKLSLEHRGIADQPFAVDANKAVVGFGIEMTRDSRTANDEEVETDGLGHKDGKAKVPVLGAVPRVGEMFDVTKGVPAPAAAPMPRPEGGNYFRSEANEKDARGDSLTIAASGPASVVAPDDPSSLADVSESEVAGVPVLPKKLAPASPAGLVKGGALIEAQKAAEEAADPDAAATRLGFRSAELAATEKKFEVNGAMAGKEFGDVRLRELDDVAAVKETSGERPERKLMEKGMEEGDPLEPTGEDKKQSAKNEIGEKLAVVDSVSESKIRQAEDLEQMREDFGVAGAERMRERKGREVAQEEGKELRWEAEGISGFIQPTVESVPVPASLREIEAANEAFSTFSLHVSDVSFKLAQAALAAGEWPEARRVRIEEFVNALDYGDAMPSVSDKVACYVEQATHPFLQERNVLRIAMRTAAAGRAGDTPLRLTILLDNSGSMERADREKTVERAFALLADQLQPIDQVTLISFARQPRLLAENVRGDQRERLLELVAKRPSEGGTNLEAALVLAYEKAKEQRADNAQNRVVLLTDGAANLGDAEPESLRKMIEEMRDGGIAFDAAGIGADGLNDEILEALTRKGDGRYYLLDRPEDADEGFARQIAGALRPAAKNVKVQVEFNPKRVGRYKLLGFEKHRLAKEDFRDDRVDAAEMAAEEAGVALYQFEALADGEGDVGTVSVRFRDMSTGEMVEKLWPIPYEADAPRVEEAAASLRMATAAAMLAAKLGEDPMGEVVRLEELAKVLAGLPESQRKMERVRALQEMIAQARALEGR